MGMTINAVDAGVAEHLGVEFRCHLRCAFHQQLFRRFIAGQCVRQHRFGIKPPWSAADDAQRAVFIQLAQFAWRWCAASEAAADDGDGAMSISEAKGREVGERLSVGAQQRLNLHHFKVRLADTAFRQAQDAGTSSQRVPGAMPSLGMPAASS